MFAGGVVAQAPAPGGATPAPVGDDTFESDEETAAAGDDRITCDVDGTTAKSYKVFVHGVEVQEGTVDPAHGEFVIDLDVALKAGDKVVVKGTTTATSGPFDVDITLSR